MNSDTAPFANLRDRSLFLVWGPPSHGRSRILAAKLGIDELHFIHSVTRRGLLVAPLKYSYQTLGTMVLLFRKRPSIVFVQSPPSFAVLFVYFYCALTNSRFVVDAHSDAFTSAYWARPRWLHRYLSCKALTTIVTNEHFQQIINDWGGNAFVLRDIPTTFQAEGSFPLNGVFNVVVVNTFAGDEPLEAILDAAAGVNWAQFYVTGRKDRAPERIPTRPPDNVHFTDFLPNDDYYTLLSSSQAVLCLTTRDNTMQRGACEALSMGKPIITSDWPLLQDYFHKGTVHVDNTPAGIRQGVVEMQAHYERYQMEIKELQIDQQQEWLVKIALFEELIEQSLARSE